MSCQGCSNQEEAKYETPETIRTEHYNFQTEYINNAVIPLSHQNNAGGTNTNSMYAGSNTGYTPMGYN
tara:strand:+ start:327 stop:530 length:204 start_codon:yes stop_codon:yes gene_type:complete